MDDDEQEQEEDLDTAMEGADRSHSLSVEGIPDQKKQARGEGIAEGAERGLDVDGGGADGEGGSFPRASPWGRRCLLL